MAPGLSALASSGKGSLWHIVLFGSLLGHAAAQDTDEGFRFEFGSFVVNISPAEAFSCTTELAETVRNIAESCMGTFATAGNCQFPVWQPEVILLGATACRGDDAVVIFGGLMDFPNRGSTQTEVDSCVQQALASETCLIDFQSTFSDLDEVVYVDETLAPTQSPVLTTALPTSVPTLQQTFSPIAAPTATPSAVPSLLPTTAPSLRPLTLGPTSRPSLRPTTSIPSASPSQAPTVNDAVNGIEDKTPDPFVGGSSSNKVGIYVAAAGGVCLVLALLILLAAKRRRDEEEDAAIEVKGVSLDDDDSYEAPQGGALGARDSLLPGPPPPGILHMNTPRSRAAHPAFHAMHDDDNDSLRSASVGDLTLISSVDMQSDMQSNDGSESFVDQNHFLSLNISKDMLGGSSEVPRNRNSSVLARLGMSMTPFSLRSASTDDDDEGSKAPQQPRQRDFVPLPDDPDDDGSDQRLLLEIANQDAIITEDFAPDNHWNPDDTEEENDLIFEDSISPVKEIMEGQRTPTQLPLPPELKDSLRRKPRAITPRNMLAESTGISLASSSGSSNS
jgi:hypothetical protein